MNNAQSALSRLKANMVEVDSLLQQNLQFFNNFLKASTAPQTDTISSQPTNFRIPQNYKTLLPCLKLKPLQQHTLCIRRGAVYSPRREKYGNFSSCCFQNKLWKRFK
jgi:hypothetical protein